MPKTAATSDGPKPKKKKNRSGLSRGALACVACRKAKRTCDGQPPPDLPNAFQFQEMKGEMEDQDFEIKAVVPCSRCKRVKNVECYWRPSNRTGRPKKSASTSNPRTIQRASTSSESGGQSNNSISPADFKTVLPSPSTSSGQLPTLPLPLLSPRELISSQQNLPGNSTIPDPRPIPSPGSRHYHEGPISYDSPSQFSAQANLLAQQGSLDGTMDAGALDEALYNMWPGDLTHTQWNHPGTSPNHPQVEMDILSHQSGPNAAILASQHLLGLSGSSSTASHHSPRSLNVMYDSVGVGSSNSPSAKDQFNQLCNFLGPSSSSTSAQSRPMSSNVPLNREIVNLGHESHLSRSLSEGCEYFFDLAAQMVPVLGASVDFYSSSSSQDALLLHSVSALGYHLSGSTSTAAPSILAQARHLADEAMRRSETVSSYAEHEHGPSTHAIGVLTRLQSFIILSHLEFGLSQLDRAGKLLKAAVDLCFREGVHKVDELSQVPNETGTLPLQGLCVTQMEDAGPNRKWLAESLRRTWWELFSQDIIFSCSTSGRIGGQIGSRGGIYVSFCADFGEELESNPRRDLCSMRIRAVTILAESIKPVPTSSTAAGAVPDHSAGLARLHTLDVMTSNLAVTAHHAFVREVTAGKKGKSREVDGYRRVHRMRTESPFVTLLILSCARVHMHRLYALPNLSFQLESGSFASVPNSRPSTLDRARIASSIEKIVNAAESLLTLVRTDYEINTELSEVLGSSVIGDDMSSLKNLSNKSSNSHQDSWTRNYASNYTARFSRPLGNYSPLLAHQPAFAACQLTACWGLVCAVAWSSQVAASVDSHTAMTLDEDRNLKEKEAAVWKQRKAISNISFAESNMETHARIWPIAGRMLQEVRKCKESVDGVARKW